MYCYLASIFKSYPFETQNVMCNPISCKWQVKELIITTIIIFFIKNWQNAVENNASNHK